MEHRRAAAAGDPLAAAVARALAAPLGASLAQAIPMPAVTVVVVDGRACDQVARALPPLLEALERAGIGRGRSLLIAADTAPHTGVPLDALEARRRLGAAAPGLPLIVPDREPRPRFRAGTLPDGTPLEFDDELREAEALLLVGPSREVQPGIPSPDPALLVPGLLGRDAWAALLARRGVRGARDGAFEAALRAARAAVPVDFVLAWEDRGVETMAVAGPPEALAGVLRGGSGLAHRPGEAAPDS